jgi:uncharacterized cupin superfamily protein
MPSIREPEFEDDRRQEGFTIRRARLARQAGSEKLGMSLFELPPGQAAYPYHWHYGEEELIVVLEGHPSLRTPEGWREMEEGEVVSFLTGERGGHQITNRTDQHIRFLAISTQEPDVVMYPDSGKVGVFERRPEGGGLFELFRLDDSVDYFEGEEAPS